MTRPLSTPDACFTAAQRPCAQYFAETHTDVTDTTSGRLVIHAEALAYRTRWCVCPHLHYQGFLRPRTPRLDGHGVESRFRRLAPFSRDAASMAAPVASAAGAIWPGGACTHWKAPPSHGAHVKRTFQIATVDVAWGELGQNKGMARSPEAIRMRGNRCSQSQPDPVLHVRRR